MIITMKKLSDLHYTEYEECKLDIYLPDNENFDTIIYFHGGGIEAGDKADLCYTEIAESVAGNGFCFVSCNYRMYPKAKFPDFLEDEANAVAFIKKHIKNFGGNGELYISGQSAGAWISMMLCLNNKYLESVGIKNDEIKGWIIDSAQQTTHFNILRERGSDLILR
jgi:acetyl esterase/lipase